MMSLNMASVNLFVSCSWVLISSDYSFLNRLLDLTIDFIMFYSFMKYGICCYVYSCLIFTKQLSSFQAGLHVVDAIAALVYRFCYTGIQKVSNMKAQNLHWRHRPISLILDFMSPLIANRNLIRRQINHCPCLIKL